MAVSAYASVLSLMNVIDNVLHPSRRRLAANKPQIRTLQENLASLLDFLEVHHSKIIEKIEFLARKIPRITQKADDIIDDYMLVQIIRAYHHWDPNPMDVDLSNSFCRNIERIDRQIISIKQKLMKKITVTDHKMGIISCITPKVEDDVVDQTVGNSEDQNFACLNSSLFHSRSRVIQKKQNSTMKSIVDDQKLKGPVRESPSGVAFNNGKSSIFGLDKSLLEIMDKLTGNQQSLQVIPIVGMPGIGKTTLARYAFDSKYIVDNFTIRIWLTVSQNYNVHRILKGLLDDEIIDNKKKKASNGTSHELGQELYQNLCGRKYLIVLDDVWNLQAWDDFRSFFPNNSNGSRVVVTTRLSEVANSLGSRNSYSMDFLNEENSWDLLKDRAFARGDRSPELMEIGKKIARSCRGLPLSLVVIGGLLANSDMTPTYWELVSKNVSSFANSENDENCLKILSLSYDYLPIHLKPCFLYMAVFEEDKDILVSELVKMWMAEGYLKPVRDKIPEEVALGYLKDLIDRNLIRIRKRGSRGNIKTCGIHDLLRDLCKREYINEDLFRIPRMQEVVVPCDDENLCFFCACKGKHESIDLSVVKLSLPLSTSNVRSLVCSACRTRYPQLNRKRFVRLMDTVNGKPVQILHTTKVRYLRIEDLYVPVEFAARSPITLLWNLQTFDTLITFDCFRYLLYDIWEMPLLRHLNLRSRMLNDPREYDFTVLESLQTLNRVSNFRCTEEVVRRIPNLKKLGLTYEWTYLEGSEAPSWSYYCLHNLHLLQKLESLSLRFICRPFDLEYITFPCSLKKLSLFACDLSWEDINTVGLLLPYLEVLKLSDTTMGIEWSPPGERFRRLKHLQMTNLALIWWIADEKHFPVLENLIIVKLSLLKNIPSGFGHIDTLQSITLDAVRGHAIDSAREMIEEQRTNGNESLRLHVINPASSY